MKSREEVNEIVRLLLAEYPEANEAVIKRLQTAMLSAEERKERAEIIKAVAKYR